MKCTFGPFYMVLEIKTEDESLPVTPSALLDHLLCLQVKCYE